MAYRVRKSKIRWGSAIGTGLLVIVLFLLFVAAVKWFRSTSTESEDTIDSIVGVLTPDPISQAVIDGAIDTQSRDASLYWATTGERLGSAERGTKDDSYYFEMKLTLPEIDREVYYYQGWLIQKIPYNFFSLGELVTNDDGEFVIEWEGEKDEDYSRYTDIVITVNQYDGSSDPGDHLVKGSFGN